MEFNWLYNYSLDLDIFFTSILL
ncbi:hypothetical protein CGLO_00341 [Colletotrichum gloeosporioides Cg-14]|uniref:Uncharacterized protein n=1 Tax=Colletotrichum gloeosporioides (strain Cg-14) TaxID=1237896 RepID=T0L455_COLGC|nr:hypothetical protein CGLO_00341 [Colletotrichum gloeosporioides Cg-14]